MGTVTQSFRQKVYAIVQQIPPGKVLTYQDVAKLAGSPGASRAVGSAMKNNPDESSRHSLENLLRGADKSIIPCHRVVGSNGAMHGFAFGGEKVKIEILKKEGVLFKGEKVDLTLSRWNVTERVD